MLPRPALPARPAAAVPPPARAAPAPRRAAPRAQAAQPSAQPATRDRLAELRREREQARAQLAAAEAALAAELAAAAAGGDGAAPHTSTGELDGVSSTDINFGYIRQFSGEPFDQARPGGIPGGLLEMGGENLVREGRELLAAAGARVPPLLRGPVGVPPPAPSPEVSARQAALAALTLDAGAVWERERRRPQVAAPWAIKAPYYALCWTLDVLFEGRPLQRFWLLETVARMPYLSYISMLHLYETLGWWRRSYQARVVHFAEEFNEAHHLLVMEALGGDQRWADRFVAQHAAVFYYFVLMALWLGSPTLAYNFSELIEAHAVDTYAQFADENEAALRALPAPRCAQAYYHSPDLYLFDRFQTSRAAGSRRVRVDTLYDVFCAIRDDEGEHVATMAEMQDQEVLARAPNLEALTFAALVATVGAQLWLGQRGAELGERVTSEGVEAADLSGAAQSLAETLNLEAAVDFVAGLFRML